MTVLDIGGETKHELTSLTNFHRELLKKVWLLLIVIHTITVYLKITFSV